MMHWDVAVHPAPHESCSADIDVASLSPANVATLIDVRAWSTEHRRNKAWAEETQARRHAWHDTDTIETWDGPIAEGLSVNACLHASCDW